MITDHGIFNEDGVPVLQLSDAFSSHPNIDDADFDLLSLAIFGNSVFLHISVLLILDSSSPW